jgi:hypothetical protein
MTKETNDPSLARDAAMEQSEALQENWGTDLHALICESCDWLFFMPDMAEGQRCPHCFAARLMPISEGLDQLAYNHPPEKLLPFTLVDTDLTEPVRRFARGIPFPPADLNPENLRSRFQPIFLPIWLVDTQVNAHWEAEVGFDYQVVSHRDRYEEDKGGWRSIEFEETRVRWEPRLGRLARAYENVPAPALEEHVPAQQTLGDFEISSAELYRAGAILNCWVRLPDRPPADAWPDVVPALRAIALEGLPLDADIPAAALDSIASADLHQLLSGR